LSFQFGAGLKENHQEKIAVLGVTFLGIGWYSKDLKEKQAQNDF